MALNIPLRIAYNTHDFNRGELLGPIIMCILLTGSVCVHVSSSRCILCFDTDTSIALWVDSVCKIKTSYRFNDMVHQMHRLSRVKWNMQNKTSWPIWMEKAKGSLCVNGYLYRILYSYHFGWLTFSVKYVCCSILIPVYYVCQIPSTKGMS